MGPVMRAGALTLPVLVLSIGCARSPDVGKFTCTSSVHCPAGYTCTGSPGMPGKCQPTTANVDSASPADLPPAEAGFDGNAAEKPGAEATVDAVSPLDKPAVDAAIDVGPRVDGPGPDGADMPDRKSVV